MGALGPHVKDTNFRLSRTKWSVDDGYEGDPLLQQVVGALGGRDRAKVGVGGSELDALAGEGEQRFEDPPVAVGLEPIAGVGVAIEIGEEEGGWYSAMVQERDGKLADMEIPVGVAGPFEVEGLAVVEAERDLFADQLVDDGAIVDATDGDETRAVAIAEAAELAG